MNRRDADSSIDHHTAAQRRRFRLTTHLPLSGERIGLTLWFGSLDGGWTGWPVFKRGFTYTIKGVPNG